VIRRASTVGFKLAPSPFFPWHPPKKSFRPVQSPKWHQTLCRKIASNKTWGIVAGLEFSLSGYLSIAASWRRVNMKLRILTGLAVALAFTALSLPAKAGAIRYVGGQVAKGSSAAVSAAASGGSTVAGGVATAGKSTGNILAKGADATADGAAAVGKAVVATPGAVAHGTKAAAKSVWKAIW
jgi:hypothetical protein